MKFPYNKPTKFRSVCIGSLWACMYYDLEGHLVWTSKRYPLAEILFNEYKLGTWA